MNSAYSTAFKESVSRRFDPLAARRLLREYGSTQGWAPETVRSRVDGADRLLYWCRLLAFPKPLEHFSRVDALRFAEHLRDEGLARATRRGYVYGARTLLRALNWAMQVKPDCDPFAGVTIEPQGRDYALGGLDLTRLYNPRAAVKLRALAALGEIGVSLPQACELTWTQVDLTRGVIAGRRGPIQMSVAVVQALERLPRTDGRVLGWTPDTARLWVKCARAA